MIRKTAKGYVVLSESGKKLGGPYPTRQMAERRLSQVEYYGKKSKKRRG